MDERASRPHTGRVPPHRVTLVPIESVELDPQLWDWVRRLAPDEHDRLPAGSDTPVYPLVEQNGRLVLLAYFTSFIAARDAGVRFVRVWTAELDPADSLVELAVAFASLGAR